MTHHLSDTPVRRRKPESDARKRFFAKALAIGALLGAASGCAGVALADTPLPPAANGGDNSKMFADLKPGRYELSPEAYRFTKDTTIPIGVVLNIDPGTSLALDQGVTIIFAGAIENNVYTKIFSNALTVTTSASAASTTTSISVAAAANISTGQLVSGTGVPSGTVVTGVNGTSVTVSQAVNVASGASLTFTGGKVVGLKVNRPEWWGAGNDYNPGSRDDSPALNAAFASATVNPVRYDGGERPKVILSGVYFACHQVDVYPNIYAGLEISGSAANPAAAGAIVACATFTPTIYPNGTSGGVLAIHGIQNLPNTSNAVDLKLHDFNVDNASNSGAQAGIVFVPEGGGYSLTGLQDQLVENVYVSAFPTGFIINNLHEFKFERVYATNKVYNNSLGFLVQALGTGGAAGELDFVNIKTDTCAGVSGNAHDASKCTNTGGMKFVASASGTGFAGIRVLGDFYGSNIGIDLEVTGGGSAGDFWVQPGTQFDGWFGKAVNVYAGTGSVVADIHVSHTYNTGPQGVSDYFEAASGVQFTGVLVDNNWYSGLGGTNPAIVFKNVMGCHANGNVMTNGNNTQTGILFTGYTNSCSANGNTVVSSAAAGGNTVMNSLIQLDSNTSYISTAGNGGSGLNKVIQNNSTANTNHVEPY